MADNNSLPFSFGVPKHLTNPCCCHDLAACELLRDSPSWDVLPVLWWKLLIWDQGGANQIRLVSSCFIEIFMANLWQDLATHGDYTWPDLANRARITFAYIAWPSLLSLAACAFKLLVSHFEKSMKQCSGQFKWCLGKWCPQKGPLKRVLKRLFYLRKAWKRHF